MKRTIELRYLLLVLLGISMGFLVLRAGYLDRTVPEILNTQSGSINIAPFFLDFFPNTLYATFFVLIFVVAHVYIRAKLPTADPFILPSVALLTGIGIILLLRLAPDLAQSRNEALISLLKSKVALKTNDNILTLARLGSRQFQAFALGMAALLVTIQVFGRRGIVWFSSKKYLWVVVSAVLIGATLVFGTKINDRRLWLFGFQTVEFAKLCMLFFVAAYIYEKADGLSSPGRQSFKDWVRYAGPFCVMWFFALIPLYLQRDLGPMMLVFLVFLIMFYYAGNRIGAILLLVTMISVFIYIAYVTGYPSILRERIDMMLDPFGRNETTAKALWSVASGGFFGTGIGYGKPYHIPEVQSDYSFVAICEEMGVIGAFAVIIAYAVIVYRCFALAARTSNVYIKMLSAGIGVLIGLQSFIIIAGNLGIMPLTGITLPLVSYGGSSMIMNLVMMGIILRLSGEENG